MKNLVLTQCFPPIVGGIENLMAGLVDALTKKEQTIVFADSTKIYDDSNASYQIRRFGGIKLLRRYYKCFVAHQLLQKDKEWRIFCDTWKSLEYLCPPHNTSVTVFAHGTEFPIDVSPKKKKRIQQTLKKATRIIAVSHATKSRVVACGIDEHLIEVWHPPINLPSQPTEKNIQRINDIWNDRSPKLLTIGRLSERKGIDTALHTIAQLKEQFPSIYYLVGGTGEQYDLLNTLTDQLQLQDHVQFLGNVSDENKSALYSTADLFLLPCRPVGNDIEGYGLVLIEAAYWGLPAVITSVGGAAEAVEDGVTGFHCNEKDLKSIGSQIKKYIDQSTELKEKLIYNCKEKGKANTWDVKINDLIL